MAQPPHPASPAPAGELDAFLVQVTAGAVVYGEGDPGEHVFFVQRGRVELSVEGPPKVVLGIAGIGDFFGEAALLDNDPRTHTARALGAATLLKVDRPTFGGLLARQPEIAARMLYALIGRDRERPMPEPISVEGIGPAAPPPVPAPTPAAPADVAARDHTAKAPSPSQPPPASRTPPSTPRVPATAVTAPALERASLLHASQARFELSSKGRAMVGRPDRASGKVPEIDLSPLDTGQTLSRQHAVIVWRDGVFYVREEKATRNGTFVNGIRVTAGVDTALVPGDRLRFGLVELVFQA